jgi:Fe2+ transport system protein FeoA
MKNLEGNLKTIADIPKGKKFKIIKYWGCGVKARIEEVVNPESIIEVVSKQPFVGPITLRTGNHEFALGRGICRKVYVEMYKNGENEK